MSIGELLKTTRIKNGIMQKVVSDHFGCRTQFISLIEADKSKIPTHMIKDWCKIIKLDKKVLTSALLKKYARELFDATK